MEVNALRGTPAMDAWCALIETLGLRFEYDARGRILRSGDDGEPPRFVLGRAKMGCIWRGRVDVPSELMQSAAKLAGREPGFPGMLGQPDHPEAKLEPRPPERLVMLERLFTPGVQPGRPRPVATTSHEWVTLGGVPVAELWMIP